MSSKPKKAMAKIGKYSNNNKALGTTKKLLKQKVFFILFDKYRLFIKSEAEKDNIIANLKKQNKKYKLITKFLI